MDPDINTQEIDASTTSFEQALERLVLESFTDGVKVEGTWDITVPVTDAPNWTVTIEKTYSEGDAPYQPSLLEE